MHQRVLTDSRLAAVGLVCSASFFFAFLDASAKYLATTAHLPVLQIAWIRFVVNVALIAAMLGPRTAIKALPSRKLKHQLLRSVFLIGATAFNFLALKYLQLDQTATIFFLSPFIVAALAGPMLGEWIGRRRLAAVCVGFLGVLIVTRPGFGGIHWAVSFSFASMMSYGLYILWTRFLARFDNARTTLVYTPLAGAVFVAPFALATWQTPSSAWVWFVLFCAGLFGALGHWLVILAHERAPAPVLAPYGYFNIVFMISLGYLMFGDAPSAWTLAGAAVIIGSGIYLLFRERHAPGSSAPASSATVPEG
jgi:drug/metabolite transporter (DMT)-like permease